MRHLRLPILLTWIFVQSLPLKAQEAGFKIAFGSCSRHTNKDQMWSEVINEKPNLWMWIGDNVYADTHNMDTLRRDYNTQKNHPDYQQLLKAMPVIGTWDDHDYCVNDGGKFFSKKDQSKEEMMRFLDIPTDAEVRKHQGVYQSYEYGKGKKKVKIILLDTRYFRDTLEKSTEKGKRYVVNPTGDILGEAQWTWLEKELKNSKASIHIIASSIQFLSNDHSFEKWGNFPTARKRMFDLLVKIKPANALFVSGDRHIAEFSKLDLPGLNYPLYDFTSSGLTHTWSEVWEEGNKLRVGDLIIKKNYGIILIDWTKTGLVVTLQAKGDDNVLYKEEKIMFRNSRP